MAARPSFRMSVVRGTSKFESTERTAEHTSILNQLDEVGPAEAMDPDAVAAGPPALLADLLEPAKSTRVGETRRGRVGQADRRRLVAPEA